MKGVGYYNYIMSYWNMFEKFGLKDVCYHVWRYRYIILTVEFFTVCFVLLQFKQNQKNYPEVPEQQYLTMSSFFVEPKLENINGDESLSNSVSIVKIITSSYIALLRSNICSDYILQNLYKDYAVEQINTKLIKASDYNDKNSLNTENSIINKSVKIELIENTLITEISVIALDQKLGIKILDLYKSFIDQNIISQNGSGFPNITHVGTSQKIVDQKKITKSNKNLFKRIMIFFLFSISLCIIVICFKTLFNPTINRKSDFSYYSIPVLSVMPVKEANKNKDD